MEPTKLVEPKPKRVLTEAQKLAFEKGREKRLANLERKRQEKLEALVETQPMDTEPPTEPKTLSPPKPRTVTPEPPPQFDFDYDRLAGEVVSRLFPHLPKPASSTPEPESEPEPATPTPPPPLRPAAPPKRPYVRRVPPVATQVQKEEFNWM